MQAATAKVRKSVQAWLSSKLMSSPRRDIKPQNCLVSKPCGFHCIALKPTHRGHTEPTYNSSLNVALLPGTTLSNNSFVVNAQCSNCRSWSSGSLDVTSRTQNFIYALGPDVVLRSDDKAAGLQEHGYYGK